MLDGTSTDHLSAIGDSALLLYLGILGVKVWLSWRYARTHREASATGGSIAVLQPILSGDPLLETTLRRNLETAPSGARFVWLIDEGDAEARRITDLLAKDSQGRVAIVACPPVSGNLNPKIAKLQRGLATIESEYVAVLDDDTLLRDENLSKAIHRLDTCDLWTGLPCYLPGSNLWSALVTHFVNNNSIVTYLPVAALLGPLTINGMLYVMRTRTLMELGGWEPILDRLCDDYAFAKLVRAHGGKIHQAITPQFITTTVHGPGHYVRLMHRWFVFANVLVADQSLGVKLLLFVLLGLPPLLLWLGLLSIVGGLVGLGVLLVTLLVRQAALSKLQRVVFGHRQAFSWWLSIVSELLQPLHWAHASVQRTLQWRTRRIRLERDGRFSYLESQ